MAQRTAKTPKKKPTQDPVVQDGAPVLRAHAKTVSSAEIKSPKIRKLIAHMKDVLAQEKHGVGLAAPQVGEGVALFIVAGRVFAPDDETGAKRSMYPDRVFINPVITRRSRSAQKMSEGCLSVRGLYGDVMRHDKATVQAQDENGKTFTINGTGLLAQIFQHEADHLEGVLYIDKATGLRPDTPHSDSKK